MSVSRNGLASVGDKRVTVGDDGLEVDARTTNDLLLEVLTELRRIRFGMQIQTSSELKSSEAEGM